MQAKHFDAVSGMAVKPFRPEKPLVRRTKFRRFSTSVGRKDGPDASAAVSV